MSTQVVQSYANAFYEMANETGKANRFVEAVEGLVPAFSDPEVIQFFKSPLFTAIEKEQAVVAALDSKIDTDLMDFIKLLARNGRMGYFSQIIEEFKENCSGEAGLKKGEVVSATALSDAEKKSLQDAIEKKLNLKVNLEFKTSPEIMGGFEARVGSFMIEDSLKSNLQKLNESLKRSSN
jgi:F-type H+-transporting ATPase subunit delta